ncbi:SDR family oxidoreductase [Actinocorallia sp. API 0066]|uniref:SDR family NAD(P)-dependent oxidoreductase n=1 Tax=Actinocorallia sp. API 0066 TaxID=2896846 RepID=UPI001E486495|nr:SDR family oxidoreductase [Actinocorallia sp. API 0066]MCD0448894.1 SDR family oxidoreductase [Actinocorallia sp. API 0066]
MGVLEGKGAIVTGGSRGIGRAVVERLAAQGAVVVFAYAHDDEAAGDVVRAVADKGGQAHPIRADLSDPEAVTRIVAFAGDWLDGLDILVNNAAVGSRLAPLAETEDTDVETALAVNLWAPFRLLRHAARTMRDGGRIVNVSTLNTVRPTRGNAPYAMSKGALEQLTLVAAQELGPRGITVNTVSPGATDTDLLRAANPPEALEAVTGLTPLGRLGDPADVADVIAFLVSPEGRWVTGQNVRATGGLG